VPTKAKLDELAPAAPVVTFPLPTTAFAPELATAAVALRLLVLLSLLTVTEPVAGAATKIPVEPAIVVESAVAPASPVVIDAPEFFDDFSLKLGVLVPLTTFNPVLAAETVTLVEWTLLSLLTVTDGQHVCVLWKGSVLQHDDWSTFANAGKANANARAGIMTNNFFIVHTSLPSWTFCACIIPEMQDFFSLLRGKPCLPEYSAWRSMIKKQKSQRTSATGVADVRRLPKTGFGQH